jgi:hypothetical protein
MYLIHVAKFVFLKLFIIETCHDTKHDRSRLQAQGKQPHTFSLQ